MMTHRRIWALLRYAPWTYAANLALTSLVFSLPVASGLIVRAILDTLSGQAPAGFEPWTLIAFLLAVAAVRWLPVMGVSYVEPRHHHLIQGLLRQNLLRQILRMPGASPLPDSTGEVLSRFRDDVEEADHVFVVLYDLIAHTVMMAAAVIIMLRVNVTLTLLIFVPFILVMLVATRARQRAEEFRRQARQAAGQVTAAIGEIFDSVQAIALAGAEERMVEHLEALGEQRRRGALRDKLLMEVLAFLFDNTVNIGTAVIFLVAARQVGTDAFTVGDFALFVSYLGFMWEFISDVGELVPKYRQVGVSLDRLAEVVPAAPPLALVEHHPLFGPAPARAAGAAGAPDIPGAAHTAPPLPPLAELTVHGLTCLHPDTGRGVAGIDLRIPRGSLTVITGRVGSGKSTLLRAVLGLLPAQAGEIRWNGVPVANPADSLTAPRCAYTPQTPVLFSASLRENILLGLPEAWAGAATAVALTEAVAAAVLEADLARMEHGLDTPVGVRGVKLSGGQVQRTAAARMFVRRPDLLVFDDLSSALDVETEQLLWERLRRRPDATCLAVSHRPEALRQADQIIVLKDGRMEDAGRLEELRERCDEMRRILDICKPSPYHQ